MTKKLLEKSEQLAKIVIETRNWICPPNDVIGNLQNEIEKMENELKQYEALKNYKGGNNEN